MADKDNEKILEPNKNGFTRWLTAKFLKRDRGDKAVDTLFIRDLDDIKRVGRYEILGMVGRGNMGVVYKGKDPYIQRDVGIKISRPPADTTEEKAVKFRERFFTEAQSAGRLLHPNIVAIYDAGMYKDFCYITMEYINGPTLSGYCQRDNRLHPDRVAEIIISACKALDYAHQNKVVHRDVKPSNIMINEAGEVKITDFGIAKINDGQAISKEIIGSPCYMSPEQIREEPVDSVSDIFSLGCVLYELLTCEKAFSGENHFSIMYKITNTDPRPVRELCPEVPKILEDITKKALARDKNKRYQTCMDLAFDLRVALRGLKKGIGQIEKNDDVIDYVGNIQFFSGFSKSQVGQIIDTSSIVNVNAQKVIMTEGEIDDSFYIILSGQVAVRKNGNDIAVIGRGECFGEMAYLSGDSRVATVAAGTDCILLKISSMLLDRSSPDVQLLFLKRFAMTLLKRLSISLNNSEQ